MIGAFGSNKDDKPHTRLSRDITPTDSVQIISFMQSTTRNICAVCSWDCTVRILEISSSNNIMMGSQPTVEMKACVALDAPVIDLKWTSSQDGLMMVVGDGTIKLLSALDGSLRGVCSTSIKTMFLSMYHSSIHSNEYMYTISTDKEVKIYDMKNGSVRRDFILDRMPLCADSNNKHIIVALDNNYICLMSSESLLSTGTKPKYIETRLDLQINSIALKKNSLDFVAGSVDGRVFVGEILSEFSLNKRLVFKAHKQESNDTNIHCNKVLYIVHSCGFGYEHLSTANIIYSAGSEGVVKVWDLTKKETSVELDLTKYKIPLTTMSLSPNGKFIVTAMGYDWSKGVWGLSSASEYDCCLLVSPVNVPS